ncbi:ATP-grasp domain-containing protein [Chromobacterium violaceum]|uniref:Argininosuccinate lyase n=1 Tax=Chromobacterium violaceum TaxID=536 RepID=A0AAX2MGD4_CHRVL|nr:ATP-grasp domain-containing protein [Chromobacterium violaceum]OLZ87564.1 hypothetical protein BS642_00160 [Chromobacterium violaceum]STB69319.1 argininosuccinate lyase [Chromobacterium violaceum]SUY93418.1 argininosuccinate lyase [Chromobacterium violaceum]
MKIMIIHQVPYPKMQYHLGLDHQQHDITYIGYPARMADLPASLRAQRLLLNDGEDLADGVIRQTSPQDGYQAVLSLSEFGILQAYRVRQHLGVPGDDLAMLLRVRDKVAMKAALHGSGIDFPRFFPAQGLSAPDWQGQTVLKPRKGASSEGVRIYPAMDQAWAAFAELQDGEDWQLEEYIEGSIHHADGLVQAGQLVDLTVSRYLNKPVDFAEGSPLGSYQLPTDPRHFAFAVDVVQALGIRDGCLHLEFFETADKRLVFLEVANRMGGAGVVDAHWRHGGIHLPSHEIAIRLGLPRPRPQPGSGRFHGWLVFPGHHLGEGEADLRLPEDLASDPRVDRLHTLPAGQALSQHITYHEWQVPVFIEASDESPQALAVFFNDCMRRIQINRRPI